MNTNSTFFGGRKSTQPIEQVGNALAVDFLALRKLVAETDICQKLVLD